MRGNPSSAQSLMALLCLHRQELDHRRQERGLGLLTATARSAPLIVPARDGHAIDARAVGAKQGTFPFMVASGHSMGHSVDRHGPKPIHRSGHPEFVELVAEDPLLSLEHGQRLFAEGDVPTCMYIVKTGQLQIRSGESPTKMSDRAASSARWA
jgi:hypothetical protein